MNITVNASKSYNIIIECGANAGKLISSLGTGRLRTAIITDDTVAALHLSAVTKQLTDAGADVCSFSFAHGEASKTLRTLEGILEFLAQRQITRGDILIALGGGVTGDITGLAAALYLRGIQYVQIPTTLLACVDSSVGGKCAVDLAGGKNLAGVFWQPSMVIINPDFLSTLPPQEFACGMAEVIKYGLGFDAELFELCAQPQQRLQEIIARCITIKRDIVQQDEFDRGPRRKLNLGHTIGHAAEKCSGYTLKHGQGVSMGLCGICRALAPQLLAKTTQMLTANGLPVNIPYAADELFAAACNDKKRLGSSVALIVPTAIGSCQVVDTPLPRLQQIITMAVKQP